MSDLQSLTLNTTIGDLPLHDACVSHKTLGQSIVKLFDQDPELPGILVEDDSLAKDSMSGLALPMV